MLKNIARLQSICESFDLFLIDQFGVLHDGVQPYPHAINTLENLKSLEKRVVIISNSGKRSANNIRRIVDLGFHESLFDQFITSGEVAFKSLERIAKSPSVNTCYLIARDDDISAVAETGLKLVNSSDKADLIIISGSEAERYDENEYRDMLRSGAQRQTRCICTNPDKKMLTSNGLQFGAGRIAEIYEELGGKVDWIGKPFPAIYKYILRLHPDCERARTLCIGDSVEHDIVGGRQFNLQTLLIKKGILTDVTDRQLQTIFHTYNVFPEYVASDLRF